MRAVWDGTISMPFVVRSIEVVTPKLAYTTLMTTLNRLAEKGLLMVERVPGQRAHRYRAAGTPEQYLVLASREQVSRLLDRYGDAALAAFTDQLQDLSPTQRKRLREMVDGE